MKKFNSLDSLKSLVTENHELEVDNPDNKIVKKQNLEAHYSIKGRSGKPVTIIKGFSGSINEIKDLAKLLKNFCGVGGSVKNGEILVQGSNRDKIVKKLQEIGHFVKLVGG
tara:strand:- start:5242 stop:5574 length:333 start_codon:yes stop_codon:yes gene_type:complete